MVKPFPLYVYSLKWLGNSIEMVDSWQSEAALFITSKMFLSFRLLCIFNAPFKCCDLFIVSVCDNMLERIRILL